MLWLAAAVAGCGSGQSVADGGTVCDPPVRLAALPQVAEETSGIARDPRRPDLFWIHNDSGHEPWLFAVDTSGTLRGRARIDGGTARDLEDIALGPCGDGTCMWLGDLGDNQSRHPEAWVHRFPLPPLPAADANGTSETVVQVETSYRIRYPEGAVDVEALVVDAGRGELLLISKGREGHVWLFAAPVPDLAPRPDPSSAGIPPDTGAVEPRAGPGDFAPAASRERTGGSAPIVDLEPRTVSALSLPAGGVSARLVTGADLSPDGHTLAVRTYDRLLLYAWEGSARLGDRTRPRAVVSLAPAQEPQGEGVAFGEEADVLYLASEALGSRPAQLSRIRCPFLSP